MRRVEVKKIMKKNQVIITSLAILIAVAGYLNFADVDLGFKDKETSTDSSSILDDVDYDLAIICYGQNDSTDGFSTNYESIIQAVRTKYPDCSIISILESSQREYTEKMTTIQSICEHYSIPVADTIAAFNNSGKAYDDLTGDGVHPNEAGQEIYFETVKSVIDDNVAASTGKMPDVDVINAAVHSKRKILLRYS